jgi:hypothetical protein
MMFFHNPVDTLFIVGLVLSIFEIRPYTAVSPQGVLSFNGLYLEKDPVVFLVTLH